MADAGMIRQQVAARIAEVEELLRPLRAEYDQLQRMAATFDDDDHGPSASSTSRSAPARRTAGTAAAAPRPSGGRSRAQQAVALIEARPGITASELAQAMGVSRNYLYRVLPKLEQRGVLDKRERGYHQASSAH